MWTAETFSIYDSAQVQVELMTANITVTAPTEVALYIKAFGHYADLAVYGGRARSLITSAIEALA